MLQVWPWSFLLFIPILAKSWFIYFYWIGLEFVLTIHKNPHDSEQLFLKIVQLSTKDIKNLYLQDLYLHMILLFFQPNFLWSINLVVLYLFIFFFLVFAFWNKGAIDIGKDTLRDWFPNKLYFLRCFFLQDIANNWNMLYSPPLFSYSSHFLL